RPAPRRQTAIPPAGRRRQRPSAFGSPITRRPCNPARNAARPASPDDGSAPGGSRQRLPARWSLRARPELPLPPATAFLLLPALTSGQGLAQPLWRLPRVLLVQPPARRASKVHAASRPAAVPVRAAC